MRKGQKVQEEVKERIRSKLKGRRVSMKGEFARGHTPWNKGTKGLMKPNKTSFKKGNIPANYQGYKICRDGIYVLLKDEAPYSYQKDGEENKVGKYEQLARIRYREAFGGFDKKMIVYHKDEDFFNNNPDNLKLITRAELLKLNQKRGKERNCKICGGKFIKFRNKKTCSKKCNKENNKILCNKANQKIRLKRKIEKEKELQEQEEYRLRNINIYTTSLALHN